MGKKIKNIKKEKETNIKRKNINLSSLINRTSLKLMPKNINNIPKINTSIIFEIDENPLNQNEFEKEYYKRFLFYMKEEFNIKIISMLFNYISSTKVIPNNFKNNLYFLKELLKIIIDLLINEIDLITVTLIFDTLGWIKEGSDPWVYIYNICMCAKQKSSSDNSFSILLQILNQKNNGFEDSYNKWVNNIKNKKKLDTIDITKTNERFKELIKPIHLNENLKKFIDYNEIVNKIVSMSKQKENVPPAGQLNFTNLKINDKNALQRNIFNKQNSNASLIVNDALSLKGNMLSNNRIENPFKQIQSSIFDLTPNNSFFNEKSLNLSRGGSRNNSFMTFRSFDGDLSKVPSMRFNNK